MIPPYLLEDLPVGTRLVSCADPNLLGTVTWSGLTRGIPDIRTRWDDGRESLSWVHEVTNVIATEKERCDDCGASDPWVLPFDSEPPFCAYCGYHKPVVSTVGPGGTPQLPPIIEFTTP